MTTPEIIAVLLSIVSAAAAIYNAWANRNKAKSDEARAVQALSIGAGNIVTPLNARIDEQAKQIVALQTRVSMQDEKIADLTRQVVQRDAIITQHETGIRRLAAQVVSLGGTPVYKLPGEK